MNLSSIPFSEAISETERRPRHLLLGNGFSIGAYDGFKYASLMAEARRLNPSIDHLFRKLDALDFEQAMSRAQESADKDAIRKSFVETIAAIHPKRDSAISTDQRESCAKFLSLFRRGRRDRLRGIILTTNYDLILYWILVEHKKTLYCWDGFDKNTIWRHNSGQPIQVYYLHGGMHIYNTGAPRINVRKLKAGLESSSSLVDTLRRSVGNGYLPTIVSEGSFSEKVSRLRGNAYLSHALDAFWGVCLAQDDALFIFGHSLSQVDDHITKLIGQGRIQKVYVGVFDDAGERRVRELSDAWAVLRTERRRPQIEVKVFHASEAGVWNGNVG
jgi:hypothetical protein